MQTFHKILRHEKNPPCAIDDPFLTAEASLSSVSSLVLSISGPENR